MIKENSEIIRHVLRPGFRTHVGNFYWDLELVYNLVGR